MLMTDLLFSFRPALLALMLACAAPALQAQGRGTGARTGDYIVAIVNQELVTAAEVETRLSRVREDAARSRSTLPLADELRRQVVDALIDERVQLTYARENGSRA